MCRQGRTVVSRGSDMQITHSFPESLPSKLPPPPPLSIPYISCNSYRMPVTQIICFTTLTWYAPSSFLSIIACVVCEFTQSGKGDPRGSFSRRFVSAGGFLGTVSVRTTSGKTLSSPFDSSLSSNRESFTPVPGACRKFWPNPLSKWTRVGVNKLGCCGVKLQLWPSFARKKTQMLHQENRYKMKQLKMHSLLSYVVCLHIFISPHTIHPKAHRGTDKCLNPSDLELTGRED